MEAPYASQAEAPPADVTDSPFAPGMMSSQARRILWKFQNPLETSVFVLPADLDPDGPREAYFQQTSNGHDLHPISQEPVTKIKCASIEVKSYDLHDWPNSFYELHYEHDDLGSEDDEDEDEDEGAQWTCSGCGETSPPKHEPLIIKASEKPYVTVHDYITAVHPWLMGLRDQISQSREDLHDPAIGDDMLLEATDTRFVHLEDEKSWLADKRRLLREGKVFDVDKGFYVPKPRLASEEAGADSTSKRKRED